jgi:tetratricopeptide (TPR) repeat protein
MCALLAAGFEADVSSENWTPYRAQMRERLQRQEGPAVDALRDFYRKHELGDPGAMLSRYIWFGLVSGPAPRFQPVLRRDELPPDVLALEGFSEILAAYYKEQNIGQMWRQVQPVYNGQIESLHEQISQIVFVATGYLREIVEPTNPRTFTVVVEPLVGRITNVRNYGDHYAIVLSGSSDVPVDVVRHAFLHFLLDSLPLRYPHVVAVKRPLYLKAAQAPRLESDLRDDYPSYFAECLVRAVELKLRRMSAGEREAAMNVADADGYVLVRPLFAALKNFEEAAPSMALYFPDMVRSMNEAAEEKRVASIAFAPGERHLSPTASEAVAHRTAIQSVPETVPNDPEAIAALTEGERRIGEKNARAAEASFERVLQKYPDQPRAWYGLGLVALLEHDAPRAKEVFGRLTSGAHAASNDPMVLAWSHVYLARIYDDEGQSSVARNEYQAALDVPGGPERARQAAQKGLQGIGLEKSAQHP